MIHYFLKAIRHILRNLPYICRNRRLVLRCPHFVLFLLFFLCNNSLQSQDSHYWVNEYGTRGQLLGGIVVGSIKDLSGTFYNPGAIALSTDLTLEVSTDAIQFTDINQPDGAGAGLNLRSFKGARAPGIFAARFKLGKQEQHHLAVSLLTRYDSNFEVGARRIDPYENVEAGLSAFSGEIRFEKRMIESWLGGSWAHKLTDRIGFGITQYFALHSQAHRLQTFAESLEPTGEGQSVILVNDQKFYNLRALIKSGIAVDLNPFTLGVTVTTPSVNLFGKGSVFWNGFADVEGPDSSGQTGAVLISNYQKDLSTRLKSPFSIAAGASYAFGKSILHIAIEHFTKLNQFAVMEPESFRAQSSGESITPTVQHALRAVTNYGIGFQYSFRIDHTFYAGFRRDLSAWTPDAPSDITNSNWNINHLTLGTVSSFKQLDITFGFGYSFGKDVFERLVDFIGIDRGGDLLDEYDFNLSLIHI